MVEVPPVVSVSVFETVLVLWYGCKGRCSKSIGKKPPTPVFSGQVFSQKLVPLKDQHKTAEGNPSDDDSYLGYSVATGDFNGDGDATDVAVGMPRGANLTGKVRNWVRILYKLFF